MRCTTQCNEAPRHSTPSQAKPRQATANASANANATQFNGTVYACTGMSCARECVCCEAIPSSHYIPDCRYLFMNPVMGLVSGIAVVLSTAFMRFIPLFFLLLRLNALNSLLLSLSSLCMLHSISVSHSLPPSLPLYLFLPLSPPQSLFSHPSPL